MIGVLLCAAGITLLLNLGGAADAVIRRVTSTGVDGTWLRVELVQTADAASNNVVLAALTQANVPVLSFEAERGRLQDALICGVACASLTIESIGVRGIATATPKLLEERIAEVKECMRRES